MVKAKFTNQMIDIIKSMIGNTFCSYECGEKRSGEVYGNCRINLEGFAVEILNEVKEMPFFDSTEDVSSFSCKKSLNEEFKPYCIEPVQKYIVNEKVLSVSIVEDFVSVNDGEYDIAFDMALIVETDKHKHIFSRDWYFGETISISKDKNFDDIYPVKKVIDDWEYDGDNKVNVKRTIKKL